MSLPTVGVPTADRLSCEGQTRPSHLHPHLLLGLTVKMLGEENTGWLCSVVGPVLLVMLLSPNSVVLCQASAVSISELPLVPQHHKRSS